MLSSFCLLVLLPLLAAASDEKRFLNPVEDLKTVVNVAQQIVQKLGADETEQQCEAYCPTLIPHLTVLCHPICIEAQTIAKQLQLPSLGN